MKKYIPERGDIIWIDFDPQTGREQAKRRPALVLSPAHYNRHGLALCCPFTSKIKNYPFEVVMTDEGGASAVLADQIKCMDWKMRKAAFKAKAPPEVLKKTVYMIGALLTK